MPTAVTHHIRISAEPRYEPQHSDPRAARFIFSYRITIANLGRDTVQLLRRRWRIADSAAPVRIVEGPGVIGQTPVLAPGEEFSYESGCDLRSGLGRMEGSYTMQRTSDGRMFRVDVPTMELRWPWVLN
ncbi:MAG: Co2+/Mg2+ efflux protein ApaG [Flavobacteriales bacterium]|nr:Co2+/Mg2+ efflux protein ApaG [Flavobacteriales bacterium]